MLIFVKFFRPGRGLLRRLAISGAIGVLMLTLFALCSGCQSRQADAGGGTAMPTPTMSSSTNVAAQEARIASKPFPSVSPANHQEQPEVTSSTKPMKLPQPVQTSSGGVMVGFPPTPEGAVAQLKAMDEAGLKGLNPETGRRVYKESFEPGNEAFYADGWIGETINNFQQSNGGAAPESYSATFSATQGMVRGTTKNFAFVCVVGKLVITGQSGTQTLANPDCQAMRWNGSRWMGVPMDDSVMAPDVWPNSASAYQVGFRDLED